jgi:hypothetical protein
VSLGDELAKILALGFFYFLIALRKGYSPRSEGGGFYFRK